jgi:iron only hydrogenase large subunit-like protein
MNKKYPIYTEKTNCQDCYKCVRSCIVKAIRINDGSAEVITDDCILCGKCVEVCPVGAKVVRSDVKALKRLLGTDRVILSLAPSFVAEFPGIDPDILVAELKKLGFWGVSETALGAEQVNHELIRLLGETEQQFVISSACPVAVDYIRAKLPSYIENITPIVSPMITHARLLKKIYGPDIKVAFIGPCIAKKGESDLHKNDVDIAITFAELSDWFDSLGIDLNKCIDKADFIPNRAKNAALYPIPGGMNDSLDLAGYQKVAVTGVEQIDKMFDNLDTKTLKGRVFVEALACEGGCITGPGMSVGRPGIVSELEVRDYVQHGEVEDTYVNISEEIRGHNVDNDIQYTDLEIKEALARVGKHSVADELNCSGCGYHSCRDFAKALLMGRAEPGMCVSYLRQKAQNKANALIRCMPSGVVLVDNQLNVIECNENFAKIFGEDVSNCYTARPGMQGALLEKIVPFSDKFRAFLQSDKEYHQELIRFNKRVLNLTIFSVEKNLTIGAIVLDITNSEMRRDHIAQKAQKVIEKNLTAVQKIACKLGENMADTEILLRAITDDYGHADYGEVEDESF